MELVYKAEDFVSDAPAFAFSDRRHRLPRDHHFAAIGSVEPAQAVKQSALAGSGRTGERDPLPCVHHEFRTLEHLDFEPSLPEGAIDASGDEHRLTHVGAPPPAGFATLATRDRASRAPTSRTRRLPTAATSRQRMSDGTALM